MKNLILVCALLMAIPFSAKAETAEASPMASSQLMSQAQAPILKWLFAPKYNKGKITRQNTPGRVNQRSKKIQRRHGIGFQLPVGSIQLAVFSQQWAEGKEGSNV